MAPVAMLAIQPSAVLDVDARIILGMTEHRRILRAGKYNRPCQGGGC
jgi:hypothetical protein